MRMGDLDSALTTKQVAEILGISHNRVCELVRKGKLNAVRLSDTYFFTPAEIERFKATPKEKGGRPKSKVI